MHKKTAPESEISDAARQIINNYGWSVYYAILVRLP